MLTIEDWRKDDGDNTLRLNYNLDETSLVMDLGGYMGEFSQKIYDKYKCNIICLEPCFNFYEVVAKRFQGNDKVKVYNLGVGVLDETKVLYCDGDSTSFYSTAGKYSEFSSTISFDSFVKNIKKIDLLKINIEGGEYDLLDHIIQHGLQHKLGNIQVQFHRNIDNYEVRRRNIQDVLRKTHKLTYSYEFIWENWQLL